MKETTKHRKKSIKGIREINGRHWITEQMYRIFVMGKQGFDSMMKDLGRMMAEAIMYIEREEVAGPDYKPMNYPAASCEVSNAHTKSSKSVS